MEINIYKPKRFLDIKNPEELENLLFNSSYEWQYASNGKSCIYHILKSLNIKHILLPVYSCDSILKTVNSLGINSSFYDVKLDDLNPCVVSIAKKLNENTDIDAILAVSLYGNPANFSGILKILNSLERQGRKVNLIDDAAQAYGAVCSNGYIGTLGDAGFFSFSPGKPTSGPFGAYFWTSNPNYSFVKTRHRIYRRLKWYTFKKNRYYVDDASPKLFDKILTRVTELLPRAFFDIKFDLPEDFELMIHRQVLTANLDKNKRGDKLSELEAIISKSNSIYTIKREDGANSYKLVLIVDQIRTKDRLCYHLDNSNIYYSNGYCPQDVNLSDCPNMKSLFGRIIEMPIDDDTDKHQYMKLFFKNWIKSHDS